MAGNEKKSKHTYEDNFAVLERITDSLNKDEIGIDDLLGKTREALEAARRCMEILNRQKGEFRKLEVEFAKLIEDSANGEKGDNAAEQMDQEEG